MRVVVDANMVMAALIKESKAREVLESGMFGFFSPEFILEEVDKYKGLILEKSGLGEEEFELLTSMVFKNIKIVPASGYEAFKEAAAEIIKEDVKDAPYVACYLALKCDGIWTNDPDYKGKEGVKIFSTKQLLNLIEDDDNPHGKDDFEKKE